MEWTHWGLTPDITLDLGRPLLEFDLVALLHTEIPFDSIFIAILSVP